jgi:hypothetical protein
MYLPTYLNNTEVLIDEVSLIFVELDSMEDCLWEFVSEFVLRQDELSKISEPLPLVGIYAS